MKQTAILFTASRTSHFKQFHEEYLRYYAQKGFKVYLVSQGKSNFDFDVVQEEIVFEKKNLIKNIKSIFLMRKIIKRNEIDIVISNATLAGIITRLAVLLLRKKPIAIHSCHGYLFSNNSGKIKKLILIFIEKFFAPITKLVITMNNEDFENAKKYKFSKNIQNIPGMGIKNIDFKSLNSTEKNEILSKYEIPTTKTVFLYAAEFSNRKNQLRLIELMEPCLKKNNNLILVLAGNGATFDECKNLVNQKELQNKIILPGFVKEIKELVNAVDFVVSASKSEGLPFNIMEAMQLGKPILASSVKGHTDLIENGKNGFLFSLEENKDFEEKLNSLLNNKELCAKITQQNKEKSNLLTIENVFDIIRNVYAIADNRLL